mmetsp:Transcript_11096/g.68304  ORF Transcript_11096/g.68304 Transcript_11096/m.68304 type:complete len:279 (+) Transcript_11096:1128-1964(+)
MFFHGFVGPFARHAERADLLRRCVFVFVLVSIPRLDARGWVATTIDVRLFFCIASQGRGHVRCITRPVSMQLQRTLPLVGTCDACDGVHAAWLRRVDVRVFPHVSVGVVCGFELQQGAFHGVSTDGWTRRAQSTREDARHVLLAPTRTHHVLQRVPPFATQVRFQTRRTRDVVRVHVRTSVVVATRRIRRHGRVSQDQGDPRARMECKHAERTEHEASACAWKRERKGGAKQRETHVHWASASRDCRRAGKRFANRRGTGTHRARLRAVEPRQAAMHA